MARAPEEGGGRLMLQNPTPRLILASASASRRALLAAAGITFDVRPADIDEANIKRDAQAEGCSAAAAALRLADLKAAAIGSQEPEAVVIGADQLLVCNGVWYDKPIDLAEAREQLQRLRGRSHVLTTAVVCRQGQQRLWQEVASPCLVMRDFSDELLEAYLQAEGNAVTGTVGAYRLEGRGIQLFETVEGDHASILGLPVLPLLGFLRRIHVLA